MDAEELLRRYAARKRDFSGVRLERFVNLNPSAFLSQSGFRTNSL